MDTRLLGQLGEFSGAQDAWRDWSAVFRNVRWRGSATSAETRWWKLRKREPPIPNATILEEDDRAAPAQLHWMMLMICKGAALNIVFLAV